VNSLWALVAGFLRAFLRPIGNAVAGGPQSIANLIRAAAGSTTAQVLQHDIDAINALAQIVSDFESEMDSMSVADINLPTFLNLVPNLITGVQTFFGGSQGLSTALVTQMLEYLEFAFFRSTTPFTYTILGLFGVIDETQPAGKRIDWTKLKYLSDPPELMKEVYGWGTSSFNGNGFLMRIANLAAGLGVVVNSKPLLPSIQEIIDADAFNSGVPPPFVVLIPLFERIDRTTSSIIAAGVAVIPVPGGGSLNNAGIALVPVGTADFGNNPLGPNWEINFDATGSSGYAAIFRPSGVQVAQLPGASASVELKATLSSTWAAPASLNLGGAFDTNIQGIQVTIDTKLQTPPTFSFGVNVKGFQFNIDPSDADGFLQSVLPSGGVKGQGDFGIIWSPNSGIQFSGGIGRQINIPTHLTIGPISVNQITIGGGLSGPPPRLTLAATLDAGVILGPISATTKGIGVATAFSIKQPVAGDSDQFGPFGVQIKFQPPSGLGLLIDAALVSGGGLLYHDPSKGLYAGAIQLELEALSLAAIGLLNTKLPDGSPIKNSDGTPGYSLLIIIAATFPPIQLGFGFALTGIGGLLGLNRTMNVDALRAGVRNRAIDSALMPADPLHHAAQLVTSLGNLFPVAMGRFLVGPMAQLAWGTPPLLVLDVAVLVEVPPPLKVAVVGRVRLALPEDDDSAVVRIHLDALGVIDFDQGTVSIDATIYDSTIGGFALSGDMALRAGWKNNPQFALAVGGFHPSYTPPEEFPSLRRLTLNLCSGDNPRLRLEAYLAVTSNSVQCGARVDLHAEGAGFAIDGVLAFDALIHLKPFGLLADFAGMVAVTYHGSVVAAVSVDVHLVGPGPWHVSGNAKVKFLFLSASVRFDVSLGQGAPPPAPPAVDVSALLKQAIATSANWTALPPAGDGVITLRSIPADGTVRAHPLGSLTFRQRTVPFGITLDKYGDAPVSGATTFVVTGVQLGSNSTATTTTPLSDEFAPGEFLNLSDTDELSRPSFEPYESGFTASFDAPDRDEEAQDDAEPLEYDVISVDTLTAGDPVVPVPSQRVVIAPQTAVRMARSGPAAFAPNRRVAARRFAAPGLDIQVRNRKYAVTDAVNADDGTVRHVTASWVEAVQTLKQLSSTSRRQLQVIRL